MTKAATIFLLFFSSILCYAQTAETTTEVTNLLNAMTGDPQLTKNAIDELVAKVDSLKSSPATYNKAWKFLLGQLNSGPASVGTWLNDANLDFKTFQNADSTHSSLGFSYDLNLERSWIHERVGGQKNGFSIAALAQGNVALKKVVNPNNFLNSKIVANFFLAGGGAFLKGSGSEVERFAEARRRIAKMTTADTILTSPEWKEVNELLKINNSWLLRFDLNGGIESNQDFSKTQNTLGVRLGGGVKSWDTGNLLSRMNVFDLPFAILRSVSRYEKEKGIKPLGTSIPTALIGFDYVMPNNDVNREKIDPKLKPFPRVNLEIGFRTIAGKIGPENLFFNSSLRFYQEIGASDQISQAKLDHFKFLTSSITSSSGFFISYTYGQLPFDKQDEQVYQLGFNYKIN